MTEAARIPQDRIDQAGSFDVLSLAVQYGFNVRQNASGETVGPCPGCGGKDRFSVNRPKNIWRCRQGGGDPIGGDAVALVQHVENCGFVRAVEILTGDLSALVPKKQPEQPADDNPFREKERRRAYSLWREAAPFANGDPVARYLAGRGLDPDLARMPGAHCRCHDDLPFWHHCEGNGGRQWRIIHRGPAMVWPITGMDGRFLGMHATWLDPAGENGKAEIFDPATGEQLKSKKIRGSKKGGRILLRDVVRRVPGAAVGEGVETVLSWFKLRGLDVSLYSAIDLGNLAGRAARTIAHPTLKITRRDNRQMPVRMPGPDPRADDDPEKLFSPHPGVGWLVMLGDGDSDPFTTHAAMARATARFADRPFDVSVDWPPSGRDFNSELMQRKQAI